MKKISNLFLWVFVCVFTSVPLGAQTERVVSPISYNPSRMGVFSYLRVMDLLNTPGGAKATNLNIYSYGNISLSGSGHTLNISNSFTGAENANVNLPAAILSKQVDANDANYEMSGEPSSASDRGTVNVYAGAKLQTVTSDSYVKTLGLKDKVRVSAGTVRLSKIIVNPNIIPDEEGLSKKFIEATQDGEGKIVDNFDNNGLVLGSFAVSKPVGDDCNDSKKCKYHWSDLTFKNGTKAKVLTLERTVGSSGPGCTPPKGTDYWDHCDTVQSGSFQTGSVHYLWNSYSCDYDADTSQCKGSGGSGDTCYWKKKSGTQYNVEVYSYAGCYGNAGTEAAGKVCGSNWCAHTPSGQCGTKHGSQSNPCWTNCHASWTGIAAPWCQFHVTYDKYTCEC